MGQSIPSTTLPTADGKKIDITKYAAQQGKKNLLLVFFRTGSCPVCVGQLMELSNHRKDIGDRNTALLALSLDDAIVLARTSEKIEKAFPLLLDPDAKTVKAFDVYNPQEKLSRPAIFLVGPKRKILYRYVGQHAGDRPSMETLLDELGRHSGLAVKAPRGVAKKSGSR